jgi:hypothetical protein
MALTHLGMWHAALHQRTAMGHRPFPIGVILSLMEGITGGVLANTRRKAALG